MLVKQYNQQSHHQKKN